MSFKCTSCQLVVQTEEEQVCPEKRNDCCFIKCERICYLAEEAPGRLLAKQKTTIGFGKDAKEKVRLLNLACDNPNKIPIATQLKDQVTCKKCLEYIASIPVPDKEQETS